jgi:hypothetical protein
MYMKINVYIYIYVYVLIYSHIRQGRGRMRCYESLLLIFKIPDVVWGRIRWGEKMAR